MKLTVLIVSCLLFAAVHSAAVAPIDPDSAYLAHAKVRFWYDRKGFCKLGMHYTHFTKSREILNYLREYLTFSAEATQMLSVEI